MSNPITEQLKPVKPVSTCETSFDVIKNHNKIQMLIIKLIETSFIRQSNKNIHTHKYTKKKKNTNHKYNQNNT